MAGLVEKLQKMWNPPDDEYDEYYEDEPEQEQESSRSSYSEPRRSSSYSFADFAPRGESSGGNRVVNINAKAQLQVVLFKPISFGEETRAIADELLKRHTVVLNLEKTEKEVSRRTAGKDQHAGVHGGHAQPHGNHHQRFENAPAAQIDQQDAEQDQSDARVHDRRIGLQQGRDALEYVVQIEFFHD